MTFQFIQLKTRKNIIVSPNKIHFTVRRKNPRKILKHNNTLDTFANTAQNFFILKFIAVKIITNYNFNYTQYLRKEHSGSSLSVRVSPVKPLASYTVDRYDSNKIMTISKYKSKVPKTITKL